MTLGNRLRVVLITMIAALVALVIIQRHARTHLEAQLEHVRESRQQLGLVVELQAELGRGLAAAGTQGQAPDPALEPVIEERLAALRASLAREGSRRELAALEELEHLHRALDRALAAGDTVDAHASRATLDRAARTLIDGEQAQIGDASAALGHWTTRGVRGSVLALALATIAMLVGVVLPLRRFLRALLASVRRLAGGDLASPVVVRGPRDLEEVSDTFERLRVQLHAQIGELERRARALRASERHHRALFDRSPLPMWVVDRATLTIVDVNDAAVVAHGFDRGELLAMRLPDLALAPAAAAPGAVAGPADGIRRVGVERHRRKDGAIIELDVTTHALHVDGVACVLSVGVDVTAARKAEAQLRQAQKMEAIGQLAGGVAHDFNNLLAAIMMNAEALAGELAPSGAAREELDDIVASAERGARLTHQLLAFSKREASARRPLAINTTIGELERMLVRIVGEDIRLTTALDPGVRAVDADPADLDQVVMNLVVNARDAMPTGGRLTLATANVELDAAAAAALALPPGPYVRLTVADTGVGMDDATRQRIFEPFFTTKPLGKGTGLGLANVFGVVQRCGGAIDVDSAPGRGAVFALYLPCSHAASTTAARPPRAHSEAGHETVLVVEDDPQVRAGIVRMLRGWGYACVEAADGEQALTALAAHAGAVELLLTDLVMPGMDGRALAAEVRRRCPGVKTLLMSGYTEHAAVTTARADDEPLIEKPFSAAALSTALRRALVAEAPATAA